MLKSSVENETTAFYCTILPCGSVPYRIHTRELHSHLQLLAEIQRIPNSINHFFRFSFCSFCANAIDDGSCELISLIDKTHSMLLKWNANHFQQPKDREWEKEKQNARKCTAEGHKLKLDNKLAFRIFFWAQCARSVHSNERNKNILHTHFASIGCIKVAARAI